MTLWTERSTEDLIASMRAAGYDTPLELAEEFVRRGPAVVDALCALLRDPATWAPRREPENMLPVHALLILGAIADPRGGPVALEVARTHDMEEYTWEDVPPVLAAFGTAMVPDLVALTRDLTAPLFARSTAYRALYLLACDHPELRPEVKALLIDALATPDIDPDIGRDVALILYDVAEPDGVAAVREAIARGAVDEDLADVDESLSTPMSEGWQWETFKRDPMHHFGPDGTLEHVRERMAAVRRYRESHPDLQASAFPAAFAAARPTAPVATRATPVATPRRAVVRSSPKVGRNDPCPCGSGKKYKKCCGR